MAKKNYREIQLEFLRRSAFSSKGAGKRWKDLTPEPLPDILERLSMPIDGGCWKWLGQYDWKGYAKINYRTKPGKRLTRKAATVAWELANAMEVPIGLEISHTCSNEWCVNPAHLVAETHSENLKRRRKYSRFSGFKCKRGHPLEGLKLAANGGCPICEKARLAAWREKNPTANRDYFIANRERINARRRERRRKSK